MTQVDQLERALVNEFVVAGHGDLDRVKILLAKEPGLINSAWDWGGGDWETALGGASHMGRKDIAEYLLANGARMDLFCAAMLGRIEVVRAAIEADPSVVGVLGPHGISLLEHALAGKQFAVAKLIRSNLQSG